MVTYTTRRNVLKVIGGGAIGAGFSGTASASSPVSSELNAVRKVTRKYRDIEVARADDYAPISPYVPGMGFHFSDRAPPFGEDAQDPPVLVYFTNGSYTPSPGEDHEPDRDEDLILGAVEYVIPGDQTDDPPNIFNDEDSTRRSHKRILPCRNYAYQVNNKSTIPDLYRSLFKPRKLAR